MSNRCQKHCLGYNSVCRFNASQFLQINETCTAVALLPWNPLTAFLNNNPYSFTRHSSNPPFFFLANPALNFNCLFCPLAFSSILLCGAREGHRPWVLNYPCSTLALKPLKQCGWTDFMSAMMVWRGVILFRWSPLVHLLHLHPSFLSSLNISSLRSDVRACRYSNRSVCVPTHTYPAYAQHSADYI